MLSQCSFEAGKALSERSPQRRRRVGANDRKLRHDGDDATSAKNRLRSSQVGESARNLTSSGEGLIGAHQGVYQWTAHLSTAD